VFDTLITREIRFADLPGEMPRITGEPSALCVRVTYDNHDRTPERSDRCSPSPCATT
jgi:hypothetical protein